MSISRGVTEPEQVGTSQEEGPVRVMIVDDHPLARQGLRHLIDDGQEFTVCGEAEDVDSAVVGCEQHAPDLVIVDLSLRASTGFDLIENLRRRGEGPRVLVVSMHDDAIYVEKALRVGASGYVCKEQASGTILDALRRVRKGGVYVEPRFTELFVKRMTSGQQDARQSPVDRLSEREYEVFCLHGRGKSVKEIAAELGLSPKTIETYRESIKTKLNLKSSHELLRYAVQWLKHSN